MKLEKNIKIIRFSIYALGLLVILYVIYFNVFKTKKEVFYYENNANELSYLIALPIKKHYKFASLKITFKSSNYQIDKTESKITQTHSLLLRNRRSTLTEKTELEDILFEDNHTNYSNGSLLKFFNNYYFLEKGKLRLIDSTLVFNKMGFNKENVIKIDKKTYKQFEHGENIELSQLKKQIYPRGLIIQAGSAFFINGATNIRPIFSKKLIDSVWNNFSYIETNGIEEKEMHNFKCFIMTESEINCSINMNMIEDKTDDTYLISILGISPDSIKQIDLELSHPDKLNEFGNLLW